MSVVINRQRTVDRLENSIRFHRHLYYNKESRITDQEFDSLVEALRSIDPENKVLLETGSPEDFSTGWPEVKHPYRMRSLANAMTPQDFASKYLARCRVGNEKELVVEEKLDGCAIDLVYEEGEFVQGLTRGDGITGADISPNIKKMKFFKQKLPESITACISGEVIMLKSDFDKLVDILPKKKDGSNAFANPRNAATGISHRLDGMYSEYLSLIVYGIESPDVNFSWETEKMEYLSINLDLVTPMYRLVNKSEVIEIRQEYMNGVRDTLDFMIDGLVVKINKIQTAKTLGFHSNGDPVGHVAFKFDQKGIAAVTTSIDWRTGRTGKVTPLVWFEPIMYNGTTVRKATLCNVDEVRRLNIKVGDTVLLVKAGEIIPKVMSVIESASGNVSIPTCCTGCGSQLVIKGADLFCESANDECPAKNFKQLKFFIDTLKRMNDLEDIGEGLIEKLIDEGLVTDAADFFTLEPSEMMAVDRMGEKTASKVCGGLQKAKKMDAATFLTSLGIKLMGKSTSETILSKYSLQDVLSGITVEDLVKLEGIDDKTASSVVDGLKLSESLISKLMDSGVEIIEPEVKVAQSNKLADKSFEISGAFSRINQSTGKSWTRDELYALIESHGGEIKSLGKKTGPDFFINLRGFGNKTELADKLGLKTIGEEEFWTMVD